MKKKENQKFELKLNKKAIASIKGGAASAGGNAHAAAASGAAKNTCQWSCPGNCVSNTCTVK